MQPKLFEQASIAQNSTKKSKPLPEVIKLKDLTDQIRQRLQAIKFDDEIAANTTPGVDPSPPRTTIARMSADSKKVKEEGLMKP